MLNSGPFERFVTVTFAFAILLFDNVYEIDTIDPILGKPDDI